VVVFTAALFYYTTNRETSMETNKQSQSQQDAEAREQAKLFEAGRQMVEAENKIQTANPQTIAVGGKVYKVKQIRKFARRKINELNAELYWWQQKNKQGISLKEAKRVNSKLYTLHAKTAAYYILGLWAVIPLVYWLTWHWLMYRSDEEIMSINAAGTSGDKQIAFFLADCQITSSLLVQSMSVVGESVKNWQKRKESAESMLDEDALPKKEEAKK
jgi:hypothetical protein